MPKWKYCAVAGIIKFHSERAFRTIWPSVWYFEPGGVRTVQITGGDNKEPEQTARVIAQLGEEGWEMVGCGSADEGSVHILYFKRPMG